MSAASDVFFPVEKKQKRNQGCPLLQRWPSIDSIGSFSLPPSPQNDLAWLPCYILHHLLLYPVTRHFLSFTTSSMKLPACSRSGVLTARAAGQLRGLQCFTRNPHYASRPAQWHLPLRTFAATALTKQETNRNQNTTRAAAPSGITTTTNNNNLSLSDQIRLLMRRVPYPVAIITSTDPHVHDGGNGNGNGNSHNAFRGMTVSSFSTVTLHPEPMISFNVRRPSETLSALLFSGRFLVHLLSPEKAMAALARDFSKGNQNLSIVSGKGAEFEYVSHVAPGAIPLPLLRRRVTGRETRTDIETTAQEQGEFPFVFECVLHPQQMDVYDHTIILGKVVGTIVPPQQPSNVNNDGGGNGPGKGLCLTYADTRFWEMGHEIKG